MAEDLQSKKEDAGSYVLVLEVTKPCRIKAGSLPEQKYRGGLYLYIGRARKHLRGRLARHLRTEKKLFWHIDYLLQEARVKEIWWRRDFFNECRIASEILRNCAKLCSPICGFGASDCRCSSHLIYYHGADDYLHLRLNEINLKEVRIDDIE